MEFRGRNENINQGKKPMRRTWNNLEEEALLTILEDIITQGYCCDNGTFNPSTSLVMEKMLSQTYHTSCLKANPHVESKMKKVEKII